MAPTLEDRLRGIRPPADPRAPRRDFWGRTLSAWFDAAVACEATFVTPGLPSEWRRDHPSFREFYGRFEEAADARVVETVRLRALGGDARALTLAVRAARGMARPVEIQHIACEAEPLPSHVAEAMIAAGLEAAGVFPP